MAYRGVTVGVTLSLAAAGISLAAVQQRPVFRAGVETVQVDVVVRDRDGKPVHGLTADDFVILDRGKPQEVVTFKAVQPEKSEAPSFGSHFPITTKLDVSSNQVAQARRLVVLVLDDLHAYRGRDEVVKKISRDIVTDLGSDALMALLMTSGDYNVEITEDRSRIIAGIERFKGKRAERRPMQGAEDRRGNTSLQEFDANLRLYATMKGAGRLFSATDGRRKAFVLISESLAKNLSGLLQTADVQPDIVQGGEAYTAGNLEAMNARNPPRFLDLEVIEALESLRKSNVVTYTIDPRGEIKAQDILRECQPAFGMGPDPCAGDENREGPARTTSWVRVAQDNLRQFADTSGGFAVVNTNDFTAGTARIIDDLDNYYLLGFNTDDARSTGFRRLEVRVKNRRDLVLRYRRGYEMGAKADNKPAMKDSLFGLVAGALPSANVPLRLTAAPLPGTSRDARVQVAIEVSVPRQRLEEADARLRDQIKYSVTVVDMNGSKVKESTGYGARMVLRPRATGGPAPDVVTYQVGLVMNIAPGRYHLRASASSTKLEEGGSVYLPLDVPDFSKEKLAVSALVIGYASGPRVPATVGAPPPVARGRSGLAGRGAPAAVAPTLPFTPTLDREFLVTDDVALYFEIARRDHEREITVDLMAVDGTNQVARQFGQKLAASSAGKVTVRLPLKEIGPGAFRLRVRAWDGANEAISEVPILIK